MSASRTGSHDGDLHIHSNSAGSVTAAGEGNNFIIEDSATLVCQFYFQIIVKDLLCLDVQLIMTNSPLLQIQIMVVLVFTAVHTSHYMQFNVGGDHKFKTKWW